MSSKENVSEEEVQEEAFHLAVRMLAFNHLEKKIRANAKYRTGPEKREFSVQDQMQRIFKTDLPNEANAAKNETSLQDDTSSESSMGITDLEEVVEEKPADRLSSKEESEERLAKFMKHKRTLEYLAALERIEMEHECRSEESSISGIFSQALKI